MPNAKIHSSGFHENLVCIFSEVYTNLNEFWKFN
jgi:hypothetical protein